MTHMNTKTITIQGEKLTLSELPIVEYQQLLAEVQNLPKIIGKLKTEGTADDFTNSIREVMQEFLPDLIRVTIFASKMDAKKVESLGLSDFTALVHAVLEVNNISGVKKSLVAAYNAVAN